jgi:hypothetical protein
MIADLGYPTFLFGIPLVQTSTPNPYLKPGDRLSWPEDKNCSLKNHRYL